MSWTTIAASETDVNSPLNQTLLDKIRGNQDYIERTGIKCQTGSFVVAVNCTADRVHASCFRAMQTQRIDVLEIMTGVVATGGFNVKGAIYAGTIAAPTTLLAEGSAAQAVGATDHYRAVRFALDSVVDLTAGSYYWIAYLPDSLRSFYAQVNGGGGVYDGTSSYAGGFNDPFVNSGASSLWSARVY